MTDPDHRLLIEVDGCADCPAADGWWCMAAEREFDDDTHFSDYPDWCPLLEGDRLVTLRLTP